MLDRRKDMAVHVIKMFQGKDGKIHVDPDLCVVDPGPEPSYILFVIDEDLNIPGGGKPGFTWENPEEIPRCFRNLPAVDGGKIILIKDAHTGPETRGLWFYQASLVNMSPATKTHCQPKTGAVQYMRSERHPVIINK
jgi:hypothetical protein